MTVYKQKDRKAWTYEFQYQHRTYKGSTGLHKKEDAEAFELELQRRVRRRVAGLAVDPKDAPFCQEWAGVYFEWERKSKKVKRPERVDEQNRVVLQFFGRRPKNDREAVAGAPYHDLQLHDLIDEPAWLDDFEKWMDVRGIAGSTRNHYRTTVSGWYRVAMVPRYRKITGVTMNPMIGVPRDRRVRKDVTLEPEDLRRWIAHASYHVRLAMAIAALAPKLRKRNVLDLEWHVHLDRDLTRIFIDDHKTDGSGKPIVQLVSDQLRAILQEARRAHPNGRYVITYRGKPVTDIRGGVSEAAKRAGLEYGQRRRRGITFHSIRHAISTWLAELEGEDAVPEVMRAALLSHTIETAQGYTHLRPMKEKKPLEQISSRLPLQDVVHQGWGKWHKSRTPPGAVAGGSTDAATKIAPESATPQNDSDAAATTAAPGSPTPRVH